MANPLRHWFRVLFGTRFRIPSRVLSRFQGTRFWIPFRGLSVLRTTPEFLVLAHPRLVLVCRSFDFSMFFFFWFQQYWLHRSVMPNRVVFCEIVYQVFLSFLTEYVKMIFSYSVAHPIKSHIYCYGPFFFGCSINDAIWYCVVCCHWHWWLWVAHFF